MSHFSCAPSVIKKTFSFSLNTFAFTSLLGLRIPPVHYEVARSQVLTELTAELDLALDVPTKAFDYNGARASPTATAAMPTPTPGLTLAASRFPPASSTTGEAAARGTAIAATSCSVIRPGPS